LSENAEKDLADWTKSNEGEKFCENAVFDWRKSNQASPSPAPSCASPPDPRYPAYPAPSRVVLRSSLHPRRPAHPRSIRAVLPIPAPSRPIKCIARLYG